MPELFLLRHAKSSWDDPAHDDFDRPLNARGRRDAPRMAGEMNRRGWFPQRAIVSSALRTRQTWNLLEEYLPTACETVLDRTIYEAEPDAILSSIRRTPGQVTSLLVLGHNPGLERLAIALAGPASTPDASTRLQQKFPTAGLARFEIDGPWRGLAPAAARLTDFTAPKLIS